ncbi:MAG: ParA family protein [Bacteriovoracaceae bacterium]|jgi:chromosome partitioning protein|nr:ParA family protein [Bacteriovoracaceae bacterium]
MLNRSNVGIFFDKTKGQLDTLFKEFSDKEDSSKYVIRKGSSKIFSNDALAEIIERESLNVNKTQIITVANQKGGVGKTSTVISQARNLSDLGYKVLVIDTDAQANTTRTLIGEKGEASLYDIIEGTKRASDLICEVRDRLWLIPANSDCSRIDMLLTDPTFTYNPASLIVDMVDGLEMDFVLVDTSPSFSSVNIASIASSDRVICPVPLAEWEIDGVEQVSKVVSSINARLKTDIKLDFLITMFAKNETTAYEQISKIKEIDGNLLNTLIPNASAFRKAQKSGMLENRGLAYKETLRLTKEIVVNCVGN